jgi:RimJ/RimL family protein N-acetyltransferase
MDYFLTSARLGFRCWREDDLHLAMELWGDAEVTVLIGGPFTPEQVGIRLAKEIAQMRDFHTQYWPVFLLEGDRFVGCAGLRPYCVDQRVYELGFHLRQRVWGQGLAKEAALAVTAYGFDMLGVDALFAGHHPANAASRGLLLKLGFVHTHEEFYEPTGLMHASYLLRRQ